VRVNKVNRGFPQTFSREMSKLRPILTTLGIVVAPFLVFLTSIFVIYNLKHEGIGPGDGELLEATIAGFFFGAVAAIFFWGYGLISFFVWLSGRSSSSAW